MRTRCALLLIAAATLPLGGGCSEGTDPAGPDDTGNVTVESGQAASALIGAEGGSLSATSSAGIVYTLVVPPDALAEPRTITMTPVTAVANLALSGGLAGGVAFAPSGLVLDAPATLSIQAPTEPPAGQLPIAAAYSGDAETIAPTLATREAGLWTLLVPHFSGATVGFGTTQDLSTLVGGAPQGGSAAFIAQLVAALNLTPRDGRAELAIFASWFQSVILPQIQQAATDLELHRAISEVQHWRESLLVAGSCDLVTGSPTCAEVLEPLDQAARDALAPQLRSAIFGNNEVCAGQESLSALLNVLFWQRQAEHFAIATAAENLDLASVLAGLCADVILESFTLPDPLTAGFPHSLDIQIGLLFDGHAEAQGVAFAIELAATNAILQNPEGFTSAQGLYTTVITAEGDGPITITGEACMLLPGTSQALPVCGNVDIDGRALDLTGTWQGMLSDTRTDEDGEVEHFTLPVTVQLAQNQNAIAGSYAVTGGAAGSVFATLSNGQLLNYTLLQSSPCEGEFVGQAQVSADGNTISATWTGTSCAGTHVGSSTVGRSAP